MSCGRVILCIILPPLAVLDKGCGTIVLVTLLTLAGWVPGAIAALVVCNGEAQARKAAQDAVKVVTSGKPETRGPS